MKKKYFSTVLFLILFSFNLFANEIKFNNDFPNLKGEIITVLIKEHSVSKIKTIIDKIKPTVTTTIICEGENLTLTANPPIGFSNYAFSWTGPNGYVSTNENPTINNISLADSGDYTVTITYTDLNSNPATSQNTTTVVVNAKIDPTFDATLPAICKGGASPLLSTTSTNGITGTWDPSVVDNTTTKTYTFTPDAGQCANSLPFTIFVINNVTPVFTLPASICQGEPVPDLSTISNNGIVGTWTPNTISNTTSGTYIFTPSSGQCAIAKSVTININPLNATFLPAIAPICSGDYLAPLPTTSSNGIAGTWSPVLNNTATTTYTFTPTSGQCATTTTDMTIVVNPTTATFDPVTPICAGDVLAPLPTTSTNGVNGTWSPSLNNTATTTYTFTPTSGQCATTTTDMTIVVNPNTATFDPVAPICSGDVLAALPTTSPNGIAGTWSPALNNTATTTYTFTPTSGQCATTTTDMIIVVNPTTATFDPVAPICSGGVLAALPTTSSNGIAGAWSPVLNNTATTTYTFTPISGQCATTRTDMIIVVSPNTATFDPVAPICSGDFLAPLPTTSSNGIAGTWSPVLNNTATTTYTFTPTSGQCATTTTNMTIVVNPTTATFDPVAPICSGDVLAPLPTTSTNGVTGAWSPALNNTSTTTYTFTPTSGQCDTTTTDMTIIVNQKIAPSFNVITPICSGSTSPILPTTSNNLITGIWSPATISTITSETYTFTPDENQCALTATLDVTITPNIAPLFDPIADVCYGASVIPTLPTTSNNGVTGTWNSSISNTTSAEYTFTPTSGQCATIAKLDVVVTTIVPDFNLISPICQNTLAPVLQTSSNNSITGTWNPTSIETSISGTSTYTFTPDPEQCAIVTQINITINPTIATFNPIADICSGGSLSALPTTSTNGVTGVWSPALDNTQTTTYEFTPDTGQCATIKTQLTIIAVPNVTPTFTTIAPICSGTISPVLPTTSNNLITGTWNPATVSNSASATYTFTPTTGLCALPTTLGITVYQSPTDITLTTKDVVNDGPDGIIEINGVISGYSPYQYSFNNSLYTTNTSYSNLIPGNYTITVKDSNGCEFSKVATINSICLFPNAISPNGDEYNQTFNLKGCDVIKLELFNRYGRKVNSYGNYTDQWEGTNSNGEALPDGTYFYVAEMKGGTSKSGWVFISR